MIRRELMVFLVVGGLTVLIDLLVYRSGVRAGLDVDMAKGVGFLVGTVFAYVANRWVTFAHQQVARGSLWRFAVLYAGTLLANVGANALGLHVLQPNDLAVPVAFAIATGLSATLNFIGMKLLVFRARPGSANT